MRSIIKIKAEIIKYINGLIYCNGELDVSEGYFEILYRQYNVCFATDFICGESDS